MGFSPVTTAGSLAASSQIPTLHLKFPLKLTALALPRSIPVALFAGVSFNSNLLQTAHQQSKGT
jgi:hypothetical protein